MRTAGPTSADGYVRQVRIADEFTIIHSTLSPHDADADITHFQKLKKELDDFAHSMSSDPATLPLEVTQRQPCKYLRLHLASGLDLAGALAAS